MVICCFYSIAQYWSLIFIKEMFFVLRFVSSDKKTGKLFASIIENQFVIPKS